MPLTFPLMAAIQLIVARIGRVTGHWLATAMRMVLPGPLVTVIVLALFIANTINIGADLAAMGSTVELVAGIPEHTGMIVFSVVSLLLQLFVPYHRYAGILKWLTLSLMTYVAVLLVLRLDWLAVARGLVVPHIGGTKGC